MFRILTKLFIRNPENTADPAVREAYGSLAGYLGIALNIILFAGKYLAGTISGSIAITADAINNLSDAGSSLITIFGFKLAGQKPHSDHPFGHGRWEYIAGLIVSMIIIMMGVDLVKESFGKILNPETTTFSLLPAAILLCSILVKLYMYLYNTAVAKKISSVAMKATATDCISDSVATLAVLISMIISHFTGFPIDGYTGTLVALMIIWAGFNAAKDTISPLLGTPPEPELVSHIISLVRSCKIVTGVHDLVVHDYGAGRRMISLHAEVPADGDIMATHDAIDLIEQRLASELKCHATIHMDPVATDDELIFNTRQSVLTALQRDLHKDITIHDFRMVTGPTHTNLIFDAVMPMDSPLNSAEAKARITEIVSAIDPAYNAVVTIDYSYI